MRVFRYYKEHLVALLLVILLLLCQAFTELAIPKYTSDIVDIGIQQSGIDHVATDELSSDTYDIIDALVPADDQETFTRSYDATDAGTYVLNAYGKQNRAALDAMMAFPMVVAHTDRSTDEYTGLFQVIDAYRAHTMTKQDVQDYVDAVRQTESASAHRLIDQEGIASALAEYSALGYDLPAMQFRYLITTGALMIGLALLSMLFAVSVGFVASRTGSQIGRNLRERLFTKVVSFSEKEIGKFSAASLITRGTNDIQIIQNVSIMLMRMVLYAPILALGGIIMVVVTNLSMGWIIAVAVVAVLSVIFVLFKLALPKFKIMQTLIDKVNLIAREILTGIPVIRAFGRTGYEENRFDDASTQLMHTQLFTNRVMTFLMPAMMLIMNVTSVAIVWFGGLYINDGTMQTGDIIAIITYSMVIIMGFIMIGMVSIMLPRAEVASERVDEVLNCAPSVLDKEDACALSATERGARIEFKDVSFKYDENSACVLKNISFTAEPGTTLAIIGSTGSGKSTIAKLIERFYDVCEGSVLIDDVDIRDLDQKNLREQIGYVPQKAFLFAGTIDSNIAYSDEGMKESTVNEALSIAQAEPFVAGLPALSASPISQGGTNVSGGQRQRLAIARAIATDARAYIFDDSFSALDYKTDAALRHELTSKLAAATKVIVAQRVATIMDADKIVVLDEGRLVGMGSHDELLASCEAYRQIALSQLSREELGLGGECDAK